MLRRLLPALLALLALAAAACGGEDEPEDGAPPRTEPAPQAGAGGCREAAAPPAREEGDEPEPRQGLRRGREYRLEVVTSCGGFTITLEPEDAPEASTSLVALARKGFYDDTIFHRIVPGFVIQGGDPTATGSGGPGYSTRDRPASDARYTKGVVAMAKAGDEPPGTAGSQFFVVVGDDAGLPPDYAVVGKVTAGLEVVERIGRLGDPATEQPTQPVVIERMRPVAGS